MYTNMLHWHTDYELKSYFKSEYKQDYEYAYNNFLENRKSENRKSRLQFLKNFFKSFFLTENQKMENYFAMATSHEDLERRQRAWEEEHSHKKIGVSY